MNSVFGERSILTRRSSAVLLIVLFACMSLSLYTRNNDFPSHYHPDEPSKVTQVLDGTRNLNHPLLLLAASSALSKATGKSVNPEDVLITGRRTSAIFAVVAVAACSLSAFETYGLVGLFLTGLTLTLCPQLLVSAHYFKEDTAMVAGIGICILGIQYLKTRTGAKQVWLGPVTLGVGCAVCASSKYIGAVILIPSILAVTLDRSRRTRVKLMSLGVLLVISVVLTIAFNAHAIESFWPPALHPNVIVQARSAVSEGAFGLKGIELRRPNLFCVGVAFDQTTWNVFFMLAIGTLFCLKQHPLRGGSVGLLLLSLTIVILCSCSANPFSRYALPLTFCMYYLSAILGSSVAVETMRQSPKWSTTFTIAIILLAGLVQGHRCLCINSQFADDSRQRLRTWVASSIPQSASIVADGYVGPLREGDSHRFPGQVQFKPLVRRKMFVADFANTVDDLADQGVQYVIVAEPSYGRFFIGEMQDQNPSNPVLEKSRAFYADLFSRGDLLWFSTPRPATGSYVNPELRVYRISGLKK